MPKKPRLKIIKVPLPYDPYERLPKQVFPKMPRLYLELLENKDKVKPELVNKEYVPMKQKTPSPGEDSEKEKISGSDYKEGFKDIDKEREDNYSSMFKQGMKGRPFPDSPQKGSLPNSDSELDIKKLEMSDGEKDDGEKDELEDRLKELMSEEEGDENRGGRPNRGKEKGESHSPKERRKENAHTDPSMKEPPTLAELEAAGQFVNRKAIPNLDYEKTNEELEDSKRELLFKFDLLRKSYPHEFIPEFSMHTEYTVMVKGYENVMRKLSVNDNIDKYKTYLIYGFIGVEFILGKMFKLDMSGFANQQIISMSTYEKLLIELGEKTYVPNNKDWPVEIRLLILIITQAIFFLIGKMMMNKMGLDIIKLVNPIQTRTQTSVPNVKKKKMRGPNINPEDIPDLDNLSTTASPPQKQNN